MAWLRQSDASAMHPIVLRALELADADDRILNELYGFVNRCATQSAAFERDYVVEVGTARLMAGFSRYQALVAAAKHCGYFTEVEYQDDAGQTRNGFKLVEDEDLFHMMLKAEREWNNRRKRDSRDPELTVPVRKRDGDACRYCGQAVNWFDRKSGRGGTYDHVEPGEGADTPDDMVVACSSCNSRRKNNPTALELRPAPREPLYGPATVVFLAKYGVEVEATYERAKTTPVADVETPGTAPAAEAAVETPGQAPSADQAPVAAVETPGTAPAAEAAVEPPEQAPAAHADDVAPDGGPDLGSSPGSDQKSRSDPDRLHPTPGNVGTGRVGSGRAGTGGDELGRDGRRGPQPRDQLKTPRKRGSRSRKQKR